MRIGARSTRLRSVGFGLALALSRAALAQGTVKLGMVAPFSGPFAEYGQQMLGGMKAYLKVHGDTVAGKKIDMMQRDSFAS
jgi:branched-chain amino acid transport system substrate-binding protein